MPGFPGPKNTAQAIDRNGHDDGEADDDEPIFLGEPQDEDAVLDERDHQPKGAPMAVPRPPDKLAPPTTAAAMTVNS